MIMIKKTKYIYIFLILALHQIACYGQEEEQYSSTHLTEEELAEILKNGNVLSLENIIARIEKKTEDRLLEVELMNYDIRLVYKIEILQTNGVVVNYFLDAVTGQDITKLLE